MSTAPAAARPVNTGPGAAPAGAGAAGAGRARQVPIAAALCRAAPTVPAMHELAGGACYEPKFDGFRALLDTSTGRLTSRHGTDLGRYFPELVAAAAALPGGWLLDGELVLTDGQRTDFGALCARLGRTPSRAAALAAEHPAALIAFDVLTAAGHDLRPRPYRDRRAALELLLAEARPGVQLCPASSDRADALAWLDAGAVHGIEGVVAKAAAGTYRGGRRDWVKVRRVQVADAIVIGITGTLTAPITALLAVPGPDGTLRAAGATRPLSAAHRAELAPLLRPGRDRTATQGPGRARGPLSMPASRTGRLPGPDRVQYTPVQPVAVEVHADSPFENGAWRHTVRYHRARPDLNTDFGTELGVERVRRRGR